MSETTQWENAIDYKTWLKNVRENVEIMKARFNDLHLTDDDISTIGSLQNDIKIMVIGTDRCSDTAGNLPILARIAETNPRIELRVLDSDGNATYHQQFRVNGKRKTPVVLFMSSEHEELCRWVERPNAAYKIINEGTNPSLEDRIAELKTLYSDPEIQRQSLSEFISLLLRADFILGRV
ncbi:MAG: thioredoxin family protein [Candidatus Thorarchaeota archaeon]